MAITYNIKPYALQKAIDGLGGQETLANLLSSINANIESDGLIFNCPECYVTGTVVNANSVRIDCPTCKGWGKTSAQVSSVRTFLNVPNAPIVDLEP